MDADHRMSGFNPAVPSRRLGMLRRAVVIHHQRDGLFEPTPDPNEPTPMIDEIPLSKPDITDAEINEVVRVLRTGRL